MNDLPLAELAARIRTVSELKPDMPQTISPDLVNKLCEYEARLSDEFDALRGEPLPKRDKAADVAGSSGKAGTYFLCTEFTRRICVASGISGRVVDSSVFLD